MEYHKFPQLFTLSALLLALTSLTGCGTLVSLAHDGGKDNPPGQVFGGVKLNVKEIKDEEVLPVLKIINVIDLPFSGVLDTLFLPYTYWFNGDGDK